MAKSTPAFQFYPEAYLAGTALFSHEQKGIYMDMLSYQWLHRRLPLELKLLARLVHTTVKKILQVIHKFIQDADGYFNERLEQERLKQESFRAQQRELASRRWNARSDAETSAMACDPAMPAGKSIQTEESGAVVPFRKGDRGKPRQRPANVEALIAFGQGPNCGNSEQESREMFDYYEARGWMLSRDIPVDDWQALARTWRNNREKFSGSVANRIKNSTPPQKIQNRSDCDREQIMPSVFDATKGAIT